MRDGIIGNEKGGVVKILIILIVLGGLYYAYYLFQATPRYALIQFKKAILFSDSVTAAKYLDMDSFIEDLPDQMRSNSTPDSLKKRVLYEIDSPHEKSIFVSVKEWDTLRVPIDIDVEKNSAGVEEPDGTTIQLSKVSDRQWQIVSIRFAARQESEKK